MRNVLAALGLLVAVPVLYTIYTSDLGPESCSEATAIANARSAVRDQLKVPSSAEFGSYYTIRHNGCMFRVVGEVIAQNSFGAMIRTSYDIAVKGEWS